MVREQSINAGNQDQLMSQTLAGFFANQRMSLDTTNAQSTSSNSSIANKQDTTGVGSKQWSMVHSQSNQQGLSNQSSEPPINVKQQGSKITSSDTKKSSVDDSSKVSKARNDRQQTTFEGRGGSGKPMAQQAQQQGNKTTNANSKAVSVDNSSGTSGTRNEEHQTKFDDKKGVREDLGQQRQQQGQQAKQQSNNTTKNEAKPQSSDKNGKSGSQQRQQTLNRGSETAKDNNRPAPSNSGSNNKGAKDPDTKNRAPSCGGRLILI